jgi:hypothetical protein
MFRSLSNHISYIATDSSNSGVLATLAKLVAVQVLKFRRCIGLQARQVAVRKQEDTL